MIRDITIGQYYPAQSQVHRLDPRVKIVCTLAFLVSLFLQNSIADEPVPYEEWKYPLSLWNPYDYGGRAADMRFYDGETDLSGDGIFHHDIYDHSEQPDRRNRKAASSAEPDPCSGA